jgi:outer membrane protein
MSLTRAGGAPLVLLLALCAIFGDARAQQTPPAAAPVAAPAAAHGAPALDILVVDVQSLLQNSKSAKMVRQQIEQKRTEYAKEISHEEGALRHERDALQRQQASLSAEALNKKGREFQQKVNELDKSVQAKRQALERSNGEALEKIQATMLKIINEIAKERKANMVFQRSELVMFDQSFDVTDEVLRKLDEQMPTLTVNFVAPVASNAPAAAAQPAATHEPATPKKKKKK